MSKVEKWLASPLGAVVARPWFDRFVLAFFNNWFFPLSRLWAAARAAEGSTARFFDEVPIDRQPHLEKRLQRVLDEFESRRRDVDDAEADWESVFFAHRDRDQPSLLAAEKRRLDRRVAYNEMRRRFLFVRRGNKIPTIRWDLASPVAAAADYARIFRHQDDLFAPPAVLPPVTTSNAVSQPPSATTAPCASAASSTSASPGASRSACATTGCALNRRQNAWRTTSSPGSWSLKALITHLP